MSLETAWRREEGSGQEGRNIVRRNYSVSGFRFFHVPAGGGSIKSMEEGGGELQGERESKKK